MNDISNSRKLRQDIGKRLKEFRLAILRRTKIDTKEFVDKVDIPLNKLKTYEEGDMPAGADDLLKLHLTFSLNINWLYSGRGEMYVFRNKDIEKIIGKILLKDKGRHNDYKKLLTSMQEPEMEDLIFTFFKEVVNLSVKIGEKFQETPEIMELILKKIKDVKNRQKK